MSHPDEASARAVAAPMPRLPPVTSATRRDGDATSAAPEGEAPLMLVADHAPEIGASVHVGVAVVDLIEGVAMGDELVQLETPLPVKVEHQGNVPGRVGRAEQRT